ncbi:MAG TPA: ATP-binding cassette domain-containing protein, partial [Coriobacteriia bacterium]
MASVRAQDVGVTYHGVDADVVALSGASLTLSEGDSVAVIGPSGCGKSTLLLAMAGLLAPTSGALEVGGEP